MATELHEIEVKGVKVPLIYEKSTLLPTANIQIVFLGSGANSETIPGLAYAMAKILNEGTKKLGSVAFATALESRAISLSAGSGRETFSLDMSSLKDEVPAGLALLGDLLRDPNFAQSALGKVKLEMQSTLLRQESNFDYVAQRALFSKLFAGTPLAEPTLGTLESLEKIKLKEIEAFYRRSAVLKRAVVLVGGDLELEALRPSLVALLSILPIGESGADLQYVASSREESVKSVKDTQQAYIYFGSPFVMKNYREDSYKAKVAAFVLGSSGFGSRMMEEIRVKRGLAYSAYWRISLGKSANYSMGYLQTKLENEAQAIEALKELAALFVEKGMTAKELEGAKQFLLGSEPLRNETMNQRLSSAFNAYYMGLPLDFDKEELEKISKLTLEEINRYIKEHPEILQLTFSLVNASKE